MPKPKKPSTLAERLLTERTKAGLSAQALADKAGVSRAIISHIENGRVTDPGIGTVEKIAESLGMQPADLAYGSGGAS